MLFKFFIAIQNYTARISKSDFSCFVVLYILYLTELRTILQNSLNKKIFFFIISDHFIVAFKIMGCKFVSTSCNLSRFCTDFYLGKIYDVCNHAIDLSCSVSR